VETVEIRPVRRDELPVIVTLYNLIWTGSKSPVDIKTATSIYDGMKKHPENDLYAALLDGRIVGTFMVVVKKEGPDLREAIVENLVVHPRYRRKGVGREMLDYIVTCCRQKGCRRVLVANREVREDLAAFYSVLGFERDGSNFIMDLALRKE
jgi:GNAT superfamily N-acetyltransferase